MYAWAREEERREWKCTHIARSFMTLLYFFFSPLPSHRLYSRGL